MRPSRPFVRFVARRVAALVLLMLGITLVAFLLTNLVPGDPAAANLGQRAIEDPAAVAAFRERYGLDKPLPAAVRHLRLAARARRPRRVPADQDAGHDRARHLHPGDRRARAAFDRVRRHGRRRAGHPRRDPPEPRHRSRPASRLAHRRLDAHFLDRARRSLRLLLPARLAAGPRPARSRVRRAAHITPASSRSMRCSRGSGRRQGTRPAISFCRRSFSPSSTSAC